MEVIPKDVALIVYRYVFDYWYATVQAEYSTHMVVATNDDLQWKGHIINDRPLFGGYRYWDHYIFIYYRNDAGWNRRCRLPKCYIYSNGTGQSSGTNSPE